MQAAIRPGSLVKIKGKRAVYKVMKIERLSEKTLVHTLSSDTRRFGAVRIEEVTVAPIQQRFDKALAALASTPKALRVVRIAEEMGLFPEQLGEQLYRAVKENQPVFEN